MAALRATSYLLAPLRGGSPRTIISPVTLGHEAPTIRCTTRLAHSFLARPDSPLRTLWVPRRAVWSTAPPEIVSPTLASNSSHPAATRVPRSLDNLLAGARSPLATAPASPRSRLAAFPSPVAPLREMPPPAKPSPSDPLSANALQAPRRDPTAPLARLAGASCASPNLPARRSETAHWRSCSVSFD